MAANSNLALILGHPLLFYFYKINARFELNIKQSRQTVLSSGGKFKSIEGIFTFARARGTYDLFQQATYIL